MNNTISTGAFALYAGGWRHTDKEQLMFEYDLPEHVAEDVCDELHTIAMDKVKTALENRICHLRHWAMEVQVMDAEDRNEIALYGGDTYGVGNRASTLMYRADKLCDRLYKLFPDDYPPDLGIEPTEEDLPF